MNTWSVSGVTGGVIGALRKAAEATGSGFSYLLHTGITESNLDPNAKAPTSSAAGLFQFTRETWLETMKEEGPGLGMAGLAAKITKGSDGRYTVPDPADRTAILALRGNAQVSALMAGALAQKNSQALSATLGRAPSEGELYIAHFLGAQGASALLTMAQRSPQAAAAAAFPAAAAANPKIFYDNGQPRSAAAVRNLLVAREGAAGSTAATGPAMALAFSDSGDDDTPVIEQGPIFNSIFHTGRRAPIAAYVDAVWSGLGPSPAIGPGASSSSAGASATSGGGTATSRVAASTPVAAPRAATAAAPWHRGHATPLDLLRFIRPEGSGSA